MRLIECYKTYDGQLWEEEEDAKKHSDDILGEQLDGLLRIAEHGMTRNEEFKFLMSLIKNRKELKTCIFKIANILEFEEMIE